MTYRSAVNRDEMPPPSGELEQNEDDTVLDGQTPPLSVPPDTLFALTLSYA